MESGSSPRTSATPAAEVPAASSTPPRRYAPSPRSGRRAARELPRSSLTGRVSPSTAVIARPMLVLLPVVTFLVPALLVAFLRTPTYEAEARLLVGGFDVRSQAVPGFVEASRTLASTYARLVSTPAIAAPVAEILDVPITSVQGRIGATSVPESSIIRVGASAESAEEAIRLADAAAQALLEYTSSGGPGADDELLDEYEAAVEAVGAATDQRQAAAAALQSAQAAGTAAQVEAARAALRDAEGQLARAELQRDSLAGRYNDAQASSGRTSIVSLISPAVDAGSDRMSFLQLAIAAPVLLGSIAGIALATVVVNRTALRTNAP